MQIESMNSANPNVYFPASPAAVTKLKSQLEAAGPASSHLIRSLSGFLNRLDLPKNAYKLTITSYGLSNGDRRYQISLLRLLSVFDKRRIPPDVNTNEKARRGAVQYMSNVVHEAVRAYQDKGYGYLFKFKPGYIDDKTSERIPSEFDWPLFALAKLAVQQAYELHDARGSWRGMIQTIDDHVERIFSRLRQITAPQTKTRKTSAQSQSKSVMGRVRSQGQKLLESGDTEGLARFRQMAEWAAVELQVMSKQAESGSGQRENHDLTMSWCGGRRRGDI